MAGQLTETVRTYWDEHVLDWSVATAEPGTREFFSEVERYRFSKLDYLPRQIDFAGYAGQRLLDVGCGLATDTARFAQGGARVHGIDLSGVAVRYARANFEQRGLAGTFEQMDGERMRFPDASFDVVYCHTVLHFTPDPQAMVREIRRVLKPTGTAILMTVNRRSWMNWLRKVVKVDIDHLDSPVFAHMTPDEFLSLLNVFSDVRLVYERFPVRTEVHKGLKARLYNGLVVGPCNALPRRWIAPFGHHLLGFCS